MVVGNTRKLCPASQCNVRSFRTCAAGSPYCFLIALHPRHPCLQECLLHLLLQCTMGTPCSEFGALALPHIWLDLSFLLLFSACAYDNFHLILTPLYSFVGRMWAKPASQAWHLYEPSTGWVVLRLPSRCKGFTAAQLETCRNMAPPAKPSRLPGPDPTAVALVFPSPFPGVLRQWL